MEDFDISITDLDEEHDIKGDVAKILGVGYLEVNNQEPSFPVKGIVHHLESTRRCLINLICQHLDQPAVNVIFLFESGNCLSIFSTIYSILLIIHDCI